MQNSLTSHIAYHILILMHFDRILLQHLFDLRHFLVGDSRKNEKGNLGQLMLFEDNGTPTVIFVVTDSCVSSSRKSCVHALFSMKPLRNYSTKLLTLTFMNRTNCKARRAFTLFLLDIF